MKFTYLLILLTGLFVIGVSVGPTGWLNPFGANDEIVKIRLCRTLAAIAAGGALAIAGLIMQVIFRNPLADPYVTGTSSYALLGALTSLYLFKFNSGAAMQLFAFAFSISFSVLILAVFSRNLFQKRYELLLVGFSAGILASSVSIAIMLMNRSSWAEISGWLMGNLQSVNTMNVTVIASASVVVLFSSALMRKWLDVIASGDESAATILPSVPAGIVILFVTSCAATSVTVATCGAITFVGLIAPHIARMVFRARHHVLVPASFLIGAAILLACDISVRVLPLEISLPAGVATSIIGVPAFLIILMKSSSTAY